jgi:outer membrane receptor protein involved in Fe transport
VEKLSATDLDGYCMLDARLGWEATKNFEISLVGQNLSDKQHPEFSSDFIQFAKTEVERTFYLKATWHF